MVGCPAVCRGGFWLVLMVVMIGLCSCVYCWFGGAG